MKPLFTLILFLLTLGKVAALNIKIVESKTSNSGHTMDSKWQSILTAMGHTATIHPQTLLDNTTFFAGTDALIVSSGVVVLTPARVATIELFLKSGKPVYLQTEYDSNFTANKSFKLLVNNLGGSFTWNGTSTGTLAPMTILGSFATTTNALTTISYFWWGCYGTGGAGITPFLQFGGKNYGYNFCPPNPAYGKLITTSDQDWINTNSLPKLVENITTHLITPGFCGQGKLILSLESKKNILCFGDSTGSITIAPLNGSAPYIYKWTPNIGNTATVTKLPAGTYSCLVTDAAGDTGTIVVTLTQPLSALSETHILQHVKCNNDSNGSIAISISGGTKPYSYKWLHTAINTNTLNNLAAGKYACTVTDSNNCTLIINAEIVAEDSSATPGVILTYTDFICSGKPITFHTTLQPKVDTILSSYWYKNGKLVGDSLYSYTDNTLKDGDTIVYKLTVANQCIDTMVITKTAIIKIYPGANADITASDNDICSGEEVTFTAKYITGQSYQWLPIHVFNSASGNLVRAKINEPTRVMLIASNDYCRDTAVYFVATYYCCDVIVPNAFTPNHDGLNDNARFHIDPSITLNTFYIYNRWGQLVFTTNNPTEGWDGSFKGIPQDPGTYFYFVRYSCNNIPNQIKKGDLLLIR